jgi:protein-S-isoprenylcysteine O-methyltransferase Ste14
MATVTLYYIILPLADTFFSMKAYLLILIVLQVIVVKRLQHLAGKPDSFKAVKWAHILVSVILYGIYLACQYFNIRFYVETVISSTTDSYLSYYRNFTRVYGAFSIIYFLCSLELLGFGVKIFISSRKRIPTSKVSAKLHAKNYSNL